MSTAAIKFDFAVSVDRKYDPADDLAGLFAPDTEVRAVAVAKVVRAGAKAVPWLAQITQRPLGYALDRWPEWQQMLPAQAIVARCAVAQQAAFQALHQIGVPAIEELVRLLETADPTLREQAADALRRIDAPEAIAALRHSLEQELASQKRLRRQGNCQRAVGSIGIAALVLLLALVCHIVPPYAGGYACASGLIACLLMGYADCSAGLRRTAVTALADTRDPRHIGILTACLKDPNREVRQSVSDALTQLLPHVRIQDRACITREEQTALLRALDGDNPDLAVAVLAAMQQIGDERVLRHVAFVIDSPVHYDNVREAAHECLPHVKLRIKEAQDSQVLLRSSKPGASAAGLLRPVCEQTASVPEEQLLRPR